jgi:oligosaccharide repeat unit polymerase
LITDVPKTVLFLMLLAVAATPTVLMAMARVARARQMPGPLIDPFSPWVGLPLLFALLFGLGALELTDWEPTIAAVQFELYFAGLLSYLAGVGLVSLLGSGRAAWRRVRRFEALEGPVMLLLFLATAAIGVFVMMKAGNPLLAPDTETARTRVVIDVGGWMYYLYRTHAVALLLLLAAWSRVDVARGRPMLLLLIPISIALVISGGYRSHLIIPLAAFVVFRHYYVKRFSTVAIVAVVGLLLTFLIVSGAIRYAGVGGAADDVARRLFVEIQNPAFALQRVSEYFPDVYEHFKGLYMARGFVALLPGQQVAVGLILKEMLGLHFAGGGFAPSILGGFYIDFGIRGIIGGMFACGLIAGLSFRSMSQRPTFYRVLIYAYLTVYLAFSFRGGFLQEVFPLWFLFILLALRWFFEPAGSPVRARRLQPS